MDKDKDFLVTLAAIVGRNPRDAAAMSALESVACPRRFPAIEPPVRCERCGRLCYFGCQSCLDDWYAAGRPADGFAGLPL